MSLITTQSGSEPDQPNQPVVQRIPLPSREHVTAIQINSLLGIVHSLTAALSNGAGDEENSPAFDGGVKSAMEAAIIRACGQLDSIIDDTKRWRIDHQRLLEQQLSEVYTSHKALLVLQKKAVSQMTAPHHTASPQLLKLDNGKWAAILGDVNKLDSCIIGYGDSPAAALQHFDEVFNGTNSQNNETKQSSVDGDGAGPTTSDESGGSDVSSDSDESEPNN